HGDREDFADPEWVHRADRPYDPDLSAEGIRQARALARDIADESIDYLYSSSFLRAVHTAYLCGQVLHLPIRIEEGLGERMAAEWFSHRPRTRSVQELKERFDSVDSNYVSLVQPDFPEEYEQTTKRFARAVEVVLRQTRGTLLIVGHGATYHGVASALLKRHFDPQVDPASLSRFDLNDGVWNLTYHNKTSFQGHE
ncbi:MAG: hypothetical protein GF344_19115, partial [Chitinivibrionales bacterium]|nr:hypothetical protein [Chitinivibrionales bacterium]MBD3358736.1 hypothetical protein [Chitinivibrionales bacterium]